MLKRMADDNVNESTVVGVATIEISGNYIFRCRRLDGATGINLQWEYVRDPMKALEVSHSSGGASLALNNVQDGDKGLYRCKDNSTNEAEDLLMTLGVCVCVCVYVCVVRNCTVPIEKVV